MHSDATLRARTPGRPAQALLLGVLVALAAAAWWLSEARMRGMSPAPGAALGPLTAYLATWVTMMAAMMFPSLAPMVLVHARVRAARDGGHWIATSGFVAGYVATWAAFGVTAYGLWRVGAGAALADLGWNDGGRWIAGAAIAGAGAYQLAPAKRACLARCRSPFAFLTEEWRDGTAGALVMGARHGLWCVGCCWALMAALFALGIMSLLWMALVSVLIAAEKLLPSGRPTTVAIAALLALMGAGVAIAPGAVPGFVEPA